MPHWKNSTKNNESFNKNYGLLKEFKMQLKRKISSLKSTSNVVIVIKIFFIKDIKHIETAYQLYQNKVKNLVTIIISETTLITSKTPGKELNQ